jgi:hypothetical protein
MLLAAMHMMSGAGPLIKKDFLKSVDDLFAAQDNDGPKPEKSLQTQEQRDWNAAVDAKRKAKKAKK